MGEPVSLTVLGIIVTVLLAGIGWALVAAAKANSEAEKAQAAAGKAAAELAAYKMYVAENYASVSYMRDVEGRLTAHLVRIEAKLDERTGKT